MLSSPQLRLATAASKQFQADTPYTPRINAPENMSFGRAMRLVTGGPWLMRQSWLARPQSGFLPGIVRFAWDPEALWILADLPDAHITTSSTGDNQNLWELGDVFEAFLERDGAGKYQELHVSPANHRLHLVFPRGGIRKLRNGAATIDDFKQSPVGFTSAIRRPRGSSAWQALMRIPADTIFPGGPLHSGQKLRASFSRYDSGKSGSGKILSSTSPHREPNFHRRMDWRLLDLAGPAGNEGRR